MVFRREQTGQGRGRAFGEEGAEGAEAWKKVWACSGGSAFGTASLQTHVISALIETSRFVRCPPQALHMHDLI